MKMNARPQGHFYTSNLSNLGETLMLNFENMQNTLTLKINQMPVSFCKYPRNESSDLHEILCGGQIS